MEPQGPVGRAAAPAEGGARGWAGRCAGMHYGVCVGGTQVLRRGLEWDRPEGGKAGCSDSCAEQPRALGGAGGLVQLSGVDKSAKGFSGQGTVRLCAACACRRARAGWSMLATGRRFDPETLRHSCSGRRTWFS